MSRLSVVAAVAIISAATSRIAVAETAICSGPVNVISTHVPGGLYLRVADSGIMLVCNPQEQFNRVTPENCKMILTMALTARSQGKNLHVYVDNAPTTACASITNWFAADVRYIELLP